MMNNIEALYIHIPFCNSICTYCDFYKMVRKEEVKNEYIDYLIKELTLKENYLSGIKTIYIGGGTPTSLSLYLLEKLFKALNERIDLESLDEFTIEANPVDITLDLASLLNKYHINRVSLGVQSFNKKKLLFLGRKHTNKDTYNAIKVLKENNINNINIDLIYGIEKDNRLSVLKDLYKAIKLNVTHISTYALILEEHTILYNKLREGLIKEIEDAKEKKIYYSIIKYLKKHNYIHYELSNFSLKGMESKHNLTYWNNEHYIGIGAFASYYIDDIRYTNINNLKKYYQGIDNNNLDYLDKNILDKTDMMKEEMILGLRKIEGVSIKRFKEKFNVDVYSIFSKEINKLLNLDMIEVENGYIRIKNDKLFVSNIAMKEFI